MMPNYQKYKDILAHHLISLRNTDVEKDFSLPEECKLAEQNILFPVDEDFTSYKFINDKMDEKIAEIIKDIILNLAEDYGLVITDFVGNYRIDDMLKIYKGAPLFSLVVLENDEPTLYMFKRYGLNSTLDFNVLQAFINQIGVTRYYFVDLIKDYAYTERFDHNNDESDISRGTNIISIKDFFVTYYSKNCYDEFESFCTEFENNKHKTLGLTVVKTLTSSALYTFKNDIEEDIRQFDYHTNLSCYLDTNTIESLTHRYIKNGYYKAITNDLSLDNNGYGKSFLTAEWLFTSFECLGNVDLTIVAVGYFKTVEELLYRFLYTQLSDTRYVKINSYPYKLYLTSDNLLKYKKDIMLKNMKDYIVKCPGLFNDLSVRKALVTEIDAIQKLRNGFFHKENIDKYDIIKEARNHVYNVLFLLFGTFGDDKSVQQIFDITQKNDYELLCNYIYEHQHKTYYFETGGVIKLMLCSKDSTYKHSDKGRLIVERLLFNEVQNYNNEMEILSLHEIKNIKLDSKQYSRENLPEKIYVGPLLPMAEGFFIGGKKKLIWNNDCFIG